MPDKDFDALNVTTTSSAYIFGPSGTVTPVFTNVDFGHWNITGTDSQIGVTVNSTFSYQKEGTVDFANVIVGIPVNAMITKVVIRIPKTINVNISGAGTGGGCSLTLPFDSGIPITDPSSIVYSTSVSGSLADHIYDYSSSPITRAELITNHGTQTMLAGLIGEASQSGANFIDYNYSYDAGWRIRVTYFEGPFSWFIKPTEKIINGGKIRIIQEPEDILAVPEGDDPPPGFEFYGSDVDFPSGPVFSWWISNDFFQFFVFSPISPSISGFSTWTNFGASPPTCSACLTLTLGELTILIANASGIYTLQDAKTNDTLYLRATSDTIDFKIPNPFAKTGLVP